MGNHLSLSIRHLALASLPLTLAAMCSHGVCASLSGQSVATGKAADKHLLAMSAPLSPIRSAEVQLKRMGEGIHRVKTAACDLTRECSQQDEMMGGEIDFIGTDVIPIMPATAEGFGPPQYLPPRKKYVDLHMTQLTQLIPILQDDINSITLADADEKAKAAPSLTNIGSLMKDINVHVANLKSLTVAPPYDNAGIVNEATAVHQDVSQIDKLRKEIYSMVKKDPDKGAGTTAAPGK